MSIQDLGLDIVLVVGIDPVDHDHVQDQDQGTVHVQDHMTVVIQDQKVKGLNPHVEDQDPSQL